jgi:hypothetical protein
MRKSIRNAEYVLNNYDPTNELDLRQIEKAEKVLELYGKLETDDIQETADVEEIDNFDEYFFKIGDVLELDEGIFEVTGIDGNIVELTDTTTEETRLLDENELYNSGFAVIEEAETPKIRTVPEYDEDTAEIEELPTEEIDPYSLIGKHYIIDGREMIVDSVDSEWNSVSFADVQMFQTGYPIFRSETVDFLLEIEREERDKSDADITDIAVEEPEIIITPIFPNLRKSENPKGENFRITDENLGIGGAKEKFKNNIAAIKLLKEIENDFNRIPTKEEQEILSKYVGWGGIPQAFDKKNSSWADEYLTLKNLLSESEYDSARESTLNAHYTSPTVIKAIYEGLENLGFKSGNVLEPAMGIGNFMGFQKETIRIFALYSASGF